MIDEDIEIEGWVDELTSGVVLRLSLYPYVHKTGHIIHHQYNVRSIRQTYISH